LLVGEGGVGVVEEGVWGHKIAPCRRVRAAPR
jgi:hypothetical protein